MRDRDFLAERFEQERPQLRRIAYRMLGTVEEADDAVQEAWIKLSRSDASEVENLGAWLTTVVSRVCLDMLRARRSRREEFVGSWMPEPVIAIDGAPTPEEEALIADGVGLALYVVLETLAPAERLAFVLHDMFALPFEEIARILGRSRDAARQLASRGRRRVQAATPVPDVELAEQQRVVEAFLAAAREGNFDALVEMLDPDVALRVDAGPGSPLAREPIVGAAAVVAEAKRWTALAPYSRPAVVNGVAGAVVGRPDGTVFTVVALTVANGRINAIDFLVDPAKLARLSAA
jgi:RNA polymerase sigma factor (sigma-70 family)